MRGVHTQQPSGLEHSGLPRRDAGGGGSPLCSFHSHLSPPSPPCSSPGQSGLLKRTLLGTAVAFPLATAIYYSLAEKQDQRKMRLLAGGVVRFVRWGGSRKASPALPCGGRWGGERIVPTPSLQRPAQPSLQGVAGFLWVHQQWVALEQGFPTLGTWPGACLQPLQNRATGVVSEHACCTRSCMGESSTHVRNHPSPPINRSGKV